MGLNMRRTLKLTKQKACQIYRGLLQLEGVKLPARAAYAVSRSKRALEPIYESVKLAVGFTEDEIAHLREHDQALARLAKKYEITGVDGRYEFPDPTPEDVEEFSAMYPPRSREIQEDQRKRETAFFASDTEEEEITLFGIRLEDIGTLVLPIRAMDDLTELIEDDE